MEYIFIYLLQLSGVILFLAWLFMVLAIICICTWVCYLFVGAEYFEYGDWAEKKRNDYLETGKGAKNLFTKFLIISFLLFLIPTKQTLLLAGGTYYGKKAVKQIATNKNLEKINTIIELELDKKIKELKEN